jgi:hypothetical protein
MTTAFAPTPFQPRAAARKSFCATVRGGFRRKKRLFFPALKDRIDGLKAIRDQAKADAERAQARLENSGNNAVTPQMVRTFAETARRHIRLEGGGYRRDHLRALAQRVEVVDGEVRIMGSKSRLLQVLTGKNGGNSVPLRD